MSQEGKVAFITGGLGGIGYSFGEKLLENRAKVALVDIRDDKKMEEGLNKKYGEGKALVLQCDVTNIEQLRATYQKAVDTFGGLDMVINCAGLIDEINYERCVSINLVALMTSSYMAVERMRKESGGRGGILINIASVAGIYTFPSLLAYSATKGGVISFGKSLAENLGDPAVTGIRVGTVCPHVTDTELVRRIMVEKPKYRERDITQPNAEAKLGDLRDAFEATCWMSAERITESLMKYLEEPDLHGSVLVIEPEKVFYVHPENMKGKGLEIMAQ